VYLVQLWIAMFTLTILELTRNILLVQEHSVFCESHG